MDQVNNIFISNLNINVNLNINISIPPSPLSTRGNGSRIESFQSQEDLKTNMNEKKMSNMYHREQRSKVTSKQ